MSDTPRTMRPPIYWPPSERENELERELAAENRRIVEREKEIERLTDWNHRVRVCAGHTPEIIDGPCVICENERLRQGQMNQFEQMREENERLRALLREVVSSEDDARLNTVGGWMEDILPRIRAALERDE